MNRAPDKKSLQELERGGARTGSEGPLLRAPAAAPASRGIPGKLPFEVEASEEKVPEICKKLRWILKGASANQQESPAEIRNTVVCVA